MLETLKALADPTRLRLIALLAHGEFTVQELTAMLEMGQSRISRHLKILSDAGILTVKRQGTWGYYALGDGNHFFRELWPALERRSEGLPERGSDREGLARILEDRRRRSQEFFDRHARQWDRLAREVLPAADYREELMAAVPSSSLLLEVGVGTGALLSALRRKSEHVVGVDHSPAMLEQARLRGEREGLTGVDLRLGEMTHLPLPDKGVETAVLNMVLHHAPQPPQVFSEIARVLVPGGTLLVADLVRHEVEWARERMADQWLGFDRDELSSWLEGTGFRVVDFRIVEGVGSELKVFVLTARRAAEADTTE
jgi:ArsR family transcriptional regulator